MKKRNLPHIITYLFVIIAVLAPAGRAQAKNTNPAKLGRKDFVYTYQGKKEDFIKRSGISEGYHWFFRVVTDEKNTNFPQGKIRTSRGVTMGSTESYITKQYGKTKKTGVKGSEKYYKILKYEFLNADTSAWKSCMEYDYKKGGDRYIIRFYLDRKNKVTAIAYIKNLEKFYNYPDKEVKSLLEFKTPKGQKVTTKTINGKKVYLIPKGTKISFTKEYYKLKYNAMAWIRLWDKSGKDVGQPVPEPERYIFLRKNEDIGELAERVCGIGPSKSGKYLYYTMRLDSPDEDVSFKHGSKIYYFKFK